MTQYDNVWDKDHLDGDFKASIPEKMLELFEQKNVRTVLDLGSGEGSIAVTLAKQGKSVHALEISHEGIQKTKDKARKAQVSVQLLNQDMYQALPFEAGSLDAVIAFQSLNHNTLPKIKELFAEITRILKPGGLLVVKTANYEAFDLTDLGDGLYKDTHGGITFTLRFTGEQTYVPQDGPEKGLTHYAFLPKQLTQVVESFGYTQVHQENLQWHILAIFQKD